MSLIDWFKKEKTDGTDHVLLTLANNLMELNELTNPKIEHSKEISELLAVLMEKAHGELQETLNLLDLKIRIMGLGNRMGAISDQRYEMALADHLDARAKVINHLADSKKRMKYTMEQFK